MFAFEDRVRTYHMNCSDSIPRVSTLIANPKFSSLALTHNNS